MAIIAKLLPLAIFCIFIASQFSVNECEYIYVSNPVIYIHLYSVKVNYKHINTHRLESSTSRTFLNLESWSICLYCHETGARYREPGIIHDQVISNADHPDDPDYGFCHLRSCSGTPCWCCMGRPICRPKGADCEKLCPGPGLFW